MKWNESLYFGTWQLSEDFHLVTRVEAIEIINFALEQGISNFDTANVYGNGSVESILGIILPEKARIVTKIPAMQKPILNELSDIQKYYPINWMAEKFEISMNRLRRNQIYCILLHNWCDNWESNCDEQISYLLNLKAKGFVEKIGISIPNNFVGSIPFELINKIDVIEAPYNYENNWISDNMLLLQSNNIEIILRSIFLQGKHKKLCESTESDKIIKEAFLKKCNLVIGMTKKINILKNIQSLKEAQK